MASSESPSERRWATIPRVSILVACATLLICLYRIQVHQLWRDEHSTWWAIHLSPSHFRRLLSNVDAVIAPYYVLMRGWIRLFGASSASLRLPSALGMSLAAGATVAIGSKLWSLRVGILGGALFAIIPSISFYAQEARAYGLSIAAVALSTLLLLRALEAPTTWRWAAYGAGVALCGLSHLISLTVLAAHAVALFEAREGKVRLTRRVWWRWGASVGVGLLPIVPMVVLGVGQTRQVAWIARLGTLWDKLPPFPGLLFGSEGILAGVYLGLGVAALSTLGHGRRLLVGVWAILPIALLAAIDSVTHLFLFRYLLFTLPAWALLAAATLDRLAESGRARVASYVSVMGLIVALGWHNQVETRQVTRKGDFDYSSLAKVVKEKGRKGDGIIYSGNKGFAVRPALHYELRGRRKPKPIDLLVKKSAQRRGGFIPKECTKPVACVRAKEPSRIWLGIADPKRGPFETLSKDLRRYLSRTYDVVSDDRFRRLRLVLLTRKEARAEAP